MIPATSKDVTADWLAGVLDLPVSAIDCEPIGVGVGLLGELVRARLQYDGGPPAGAPASVIVKLPTQAPNNKAIAMGLRFYEREVRFFQEVAPKADLRIPTAFHADMDVEAERFVLVLEDLADYDLADQVAGMTVDQAKAAVGAIARFHTQWWDTSELESLDWLPTSDHPITMQAAQMYRDAWPAFVEKWGHVVPDGGLEVGERVRDAYEQMLVELARPPRTIVHTDFRLDNLFFRDGEVAVIDWQLTTRGGGAYDVAYLLAQSMDAELRRRHDVEILRHWYDSLEVPGYSWEQAQEDYAAGVLLCLVIPVNAGADIDLGNERGEALVRVIAERAFGAALDADWQRVLDRHS